VGGPRRDLARRCRCGPQRYLQANDATSTVRTKLGKKIAVVGLLFDANELWTGYSNITGLEALLKRVNRDNARILKILEIYRTTFAFLGQKLKSCAGASIRVAAGGSPIPERPSRTRCGARVPPARVITAG
jgi:hypothetical protein